MPDAHKNFAVSLIAGTTSNNGLNAGTGGLTITVTTGDGDKFPAAPFNATIWPQGTGTVPNIFNSEIVRVTAKVNNTFTIARLAETAQATPTLHNIIVGDQIAATITNKTMADVERMTRLYANANFR